MPAEVEAMLPKAAAKITATIRVNLLTLDELRDTIIYLFLKNLFKVSLIVSENLEPSGRASLKI